MNGADALLLELPTSRYLNTYMPFHMQDHSRAVSLASWELNRYKSAIFERGSERQKEPRISITYLPVNSVRPQSLPLNDIPS